MKWCYSSDKKKKTVFIQLYQIEITTSLDRLVSISLYSPVGQSWLSCAISDSLVSLVFSHYLPHCNYCGPVTNFS